MPDVAFEWACCMEKIILSLFYIPTEVTNLLCVDSRYPAKYSIKRKLRRFSVWIIDPIPDIVFKWKLQRYSMWIVDDTPEVSSERRL